MLRHPHRPGGGLIPDHQEIERYSGALPRGRWRAFGMPENPSEIQDQANPALPSNLTAVEYDAFVAATLALREVQAAYAREENHP